MTPPGRRMAYGPGPCRFGDLRLPQGPGPHPAAIVIHGGFWRNAYGLDHIGPLAAALARDGVATWTVEYRRLGDEGGGWPGTGEDIALAAGYLTEIAAWHHLDLARVVALGHSAGGHLALWLASRCPKALCGVIALAPVADLRRAWELRLSNDAVAEFLGGSPEEAAQRYREASPIERLPLGVPVRVLHGERDEDVPIEISRRFVEAAVASGDDARLVAPAGVGHFEWIDPEAREWPLVRDAVRELL